jgi:hypothetical protein
VDRPTPMDVEEVQALLHLECLTRNLRSLTATHPEAEAKATALEALARVQVARHHLTPMVPTELAGVVLFIMKKDLTMTRATADDIKDLDRLTTPDPTRHHPRLRVRLPASASTSGPTRTAVGNARERRRRRLIRLSSPIKDHRTADG